MQNTSPYVAMQRLDMHLRPMLRDIDQELLEPDARKAVKSIRSLMVDAKLDIRDYELSETRDEQLKNAVVAKQRVEKLQANILLAGNVFGPADVAQLSAQLEQISQNLQ
jgi:hypothetical protein